MVFSRSITSVESLGTLPPVTEHKHAVLFECVRLRRTTTV